MKQKICTRFGTYAHTKQISCRFPEPLGHDVLYFGGSLKPGKGADSNLLFWPKTTSAYCGCRHPSLRVIKFLSDKVFLFTPRVIEYFLLAPIECPRKIYKIELIMSEAAPPPVYYMVNSGVSVGDGSLWEFISRVSKMGTPSIVVKPGAPLLRVVLSFFARDQEGLGPFTHPVHY